MAPKRKANKSLETQAEGVPELQREANGDGGELPRTRSATGRGLAGVTLGQSGGGRVTRGKGKGGPPGEGKGASDPVRGDTTVSGGRGRASSAACQERLTRNQGNAALKPVSGRSRAPAEATSDRSRASAVVARGRSRAPVKAARGSSRAPAEEEVSVVEVPRGEQEHSLTEIVARRARLLRDAKSLTRCHQRYFVMDADTKQTLEPKRCSVEALTQLHEGLRLARQAVEVANDEVATLEAVTARVVDLAQLRFPGLEIEVPEVAEPKTITDREAVFSQISSALDLGGGQAGSSLEWIRLMDSIRVWSEPSSSLFSSSRTSIEALTVRGQIVRARAEVSRLRVLADSVASMQAARNEAMLIECQEFWADGEEQDLEIATRRDVLHSEQKAERMEILGKQQVAQGRLGLLMAQEKELLEDQGDSGEVTNEERERKEEGRLQEWKAEYPSRTLPLEGRSVQAASRCASSEVTHRDPPVPEKGWWEPSNAESESTAVRLSPYYAPVPVAPSKLHTSSSSTLPPPYGEAPTSSSISLSQHGETPTSYAPSACFLPSQAPPHSVSASSMVDTSFHVGRTPSAYAAASDFAPSQGRLVGQSQSTPSWSDEQWTAWQALSLEEQQAWTNREQAQREEVEWYEGRNNSEWEQGPSINDQARIDEELDDNRDWEESGAWDGPVSTRGRGYGSGVWCSNTVDTSDEELEVAVDVAEISSPRILFPEAVGEVEASPSPGTATEQPEMIAVVRQMFDSFVLAPNASENAHIEDMPTVSEVLVAHMSQDALPTVTECLAANVSPSGSSVQSSSVVNVSPSGSSVQSSSVVNVSPNGSTVQSSSVVNPMFDSFVPAPEALVVTSNVVSSAVMALEPYSSSGDAAVSVPLEVAGSSTLGVSVTNHRLDAVEPVLDTSGGIFSAEGTINSEVSTAAGVMGGHMSSSDSSVIVGLSPSTLLVPESSVGNHMVESFVSTPDSSVGTLIGAVSTAATVSVLGALPTTTAGSGNTPVREVAPVVPVSTLSFDSLDSPVWLTVSSRDSQPSALPSSWVRSGQAIPSVWVDDSVLIQASTVGRSRLDDDEARREGRSAYRRNPACLYLRGFARAYVVFIFQHMSGYPWFSDEAIAASDLGPRIDPSLVEIYLRGFRQAVRVIERADQRANERLLALAEMENDEDDDDLPALVSRGDIESPRTPPSPYEEDMLEEGHGLLEDGIQMTLPLEVLQAACDVYTQQGLEDGLERIWERRSVGLPGWVSRSVGRENCGHNVRMEFLDHYMLGYERARIIVRNLLLGCEDDMPSLCSTAFDLPFLDRVSMLAFEVVDSGPISGAVDGYQPLRYEARIRLRNQGRAAARMSRQVDRTMSDDDRALLNVRVAAFRSSSNVEEDEEPWMLRAGANNGNSLGSWLPGHPLGPRVVPPLSGWPLGLGSEQSNRENIQVPQQAGHPFTQNAFIQYGVPAHFGFSPYGSINHTSPAFQAYAPQAVSSFGSPVPAVYGPQAVQPYATPSSYSSFQSSPAALFPVPQPVDGTSVSSFAPSTQLPHSNDMGVGRKGGKGNVVGKGGSGKGKGVGRGKGRPSGKGVTAPVTVLGVTPSPYFGKGTFDRGLGGKGLGGKGNVSSSQDSHSDQLISQLVSSQHITNSIMAQQLQQKSDHMKRTDPAGTEKWRVDHPEARIIRFFLSNLSQGVGVAAILGGDVKDFMLAGAHLLDDPEKNFTVFRIPVLLTSDMFLTLANGHVECISLSECKSTNRAAVVLAPIRTLSAALLVKAVPRLTKPEETLPASWAVLRECMFNFASLMRFFFCAALGDAVMRLVSELDNMFTNSMETSSLTVLAEIFYDTMKAVTLSAKRAYNHVTAELSHGAVLPTGVTQLLIHTREVLTTPKPKWDATGTLGFGWLGESALACFDPANRESTLAKWLSRKGQRIQLAILGLGDEDRHQKRKEIEGSKIKSMVVVPGSTTEAAVGTTLTKRQRLAAAKKARKVSFNVSSSAPSSSLAAATSSSFSFAPSPANSSLAPSSSSSSSLAATDSSSHTAPSQSAAVSSTPFPSHAGNGKGGKGGGKGGAASKVERAEPNLLLKYEDRVKLLSQQRVLGEVGCFKFWSRTGCPGCHFLHLPIPQMLSAAQQALVNEWGGLARGPVTSRAQMEATKIAALAEEKEALRAKGASGSGIESTNQISKRDGQGDVGSVDLAKAVGSCHPAEQHTAVVVEALRARRADEVSGVKVPALGRNPRSRFECLAPLNDFRRLCDLWQGWLEKSCTAARSWSDEVAAYVASLLAQQVEEKFGSAGAWKGVKFARSDVATWVRVSVDCLQRSTMAGSSPAAQDLSSWNFALALKERGSERTIIPVVEGVCTPGVFKFCNRGIVGEERCITFTLNDEQYVSLDLGEYIGDRAGQCVLLCLAAGAGVTGQAFLTVATSEVARLKEAFDGEDRLTAAQARVEQYREDTVRGCSNDVSMICDLELEGLFLHIRVVVLVVGTDGAVAIRVMNHPSWKAANNGSKTIVLVIVDGHCTILRKLPSRFSQPVLKDFNVRPGDMKALLASLVRVGSLLKTRTFLYASSVVGAPIFQREREVLHDTRAKGLVKDRVGSASAEAVWVEEHIAGRGDRSAEDAAWMWRTFRTKLSEEGVTPAAAIPGKLYRGLVLRKVYGGITPESRLKVAELRSDEYKHHIKWNQVSIMEAVWGEEVSVLAHSIVMKAYEVLEGAEKGAIKKKDVKATKVLEQGLEVLRSRCDSLVVATGGICPALACLRQAAAWVRAPTMDPQRILALEHEMGSTLTQAVKDLAIHGAQLLQKTVPAPGTGTRVKAAPFRSSEKVAGEIGRTLAWDVSRGSALLLSDDMASWLEVAEAQYHSMAAVEKKVLPDVANITPIGQARVTPRGDTRPISDVRLLNAWLAEEAKTAVAGETAQVEAVTPKVEGLADVLCTNCERYVGLRQYGHKFDVTSAFKKMFLAINDAAAQAVVVPRRAGSTASKGDTIAVQGSLVFGWTASPSNFGVAAHGVVEALAQSGLVNARVLGPEPFENSVFVDDIVGVTPRIGNRAENIGVVTVLAMTIMFGDDAVHPEKKILEGTPASCFDAWGFHIDCSECVYGGGKSIRIGVSAEKVAKLRNLVHAELRQSVYARTITRREVEVIVGLLVFLSKVCVGLKVTLAYFYAVMKGVSPRDEALIIPGTESEERWRALEEVVELVNVMATNDLTDRCLRQGTSLVGSMCSLLPISRQVAMGVETLTLSTDATLEKIGGYCQELNVFFSLDAEPLMVLVRHACGAHEEMQTLIAETELLAIWVLMEVLRELSGFQNKLVLAGIDNSVVAMVVNGVAGQNSAMRFMRGSIGRIEVSCGCQLGALWLQGANNTDADDLTRGRVAEFKRRNPEAVEADCAAWRMRLVQWKRHSLALVTEEVHALARDKMEQARASRAGGGGEGALNDISSNYDGGEEAAVDDEEVDWVERWTEDMVNTRAGGSSRRSRMQSDIPFGTMPGEVFYDNFSRDLLRDSLQSASRTTYDSNFRHWGVYCERIARPQGFWLLGDWEDEFIMMAFNDHKIAFGYSPSLLHGIWAAVAHVHCRHGLPNPSLNKPMLRLQLQGHRLRYGGEERKVPVTPALLRVIQTDLQVEALEDLSARSKWNRAVLWAGVLTGFVFLLRARNAFRTLAEPDHEQCITGSRWTFFRNGIEVRRKDLRWADEAILILAKGKCDPNGQRSANSVKKSRGSLCVIAALVELEILNPGHFENDNQYTFVDFEGYVLRCSTVVKVLRHAARKLNIPPKALSVISLRAGGATAMWNAGFSEADIMRRGRWASDCWKRYIWEGRERGEEVASRMVNTSVSLVAPLDYFRRHNK